MVDSTNARALAALAEGDARHGDVHVAEGQTAGRGRHGRTWASPPGEGLYLSIVLRPAALPHPAALTMGAGLAVLECVRALGVREAHLKWPNDVLVRGLPEQATERARGAKLAGILVEARALDARAPHAVVGIGINVLQRTFPAELEAERAVTSLARLGLAYRPPQVLESLLAHLDPRLAEACAEPAASARAYAEALGLLGRSVRVEHARGTARGTLRALTLRGLELGGRGEDERVALEHVRALDGEDGLPA